MSKQPANTTKKATVKTKKRVAQNVPSGIAHVKATFNNGILKVGLPKTEEAEARE